MGSGPGLGCGTQELKFILTGAAGDVHPCLVTLETVALQSLTSAPGYQALPQARLVLEGVWLCQIVKLSEWAQSPSEWERPGQQPCLHLPSAHPPKADEIAVPHTEPQPPALS